MEKPRRKLVELPMHAVLSWDAPTDVSVDVSVYEKSTPPADLQPSADPQ